jgi:hypothetical protein
MGFVEHRQRPGRLVGQDLHHESEGETALRRVARSEAHVRADDLGQARRAGHAAGSDLSRDDRVRLQSKGTVSEESRRVVAVHQ